MTIIDRNTVVSFHYTVSSLDGDIINTSEGDGPSSYLHGYGNIASFLEKEFTGKKGAERFTVILPPDEGYGLFDAGEDAYTTVPKEEMPKGIWFQKGFPIQRIIDGKEMTMYMHDYVNGAFVLTKNHPLAGVTLVYDIEIIAVRAALPLEIRRCFLSCQIPVNSPICIGSYS